ncbi:MAG: hypothetical protein ABIJ42_00200 [Acidobacteriota bacterium]
MSEKWVYLFEEVEAAEKKVMSLPTYVRQESGASSFNPVKLLLVTA